MNPAPIAIAAAEHRETFAIADDLLRLNANAASAGEGRRLCLRKQFEELSRELAGRIGLEVAACRHGKVLLPIRQAGAIHVLILPAVDLDAAEIRDYEGAAVDLFGRAIAGDPIAGNDRELLTGIIMMAAGLPADEAEPLIDRLAFLAVDPPRDLVAIDLVIRSLAGRDQSTPLRLSPGTDPGGDPTPSVRFPFEEADLRPPS